MVVWWVVVRCRDTFRWRARHGLGIEGIALHDRHTVCHLKLFGRAHKRRHGVPGSYGMPHDVLPNATGGSKYDDLHVLPAFTRLCVNTSGNTLRAIRDARGGSLRPVLPNHGPRGSWGARFPREWRG